MTKFELFELAKEEEIAKAAADAEAAAKAEAEKEAAEIAAAEAAERLKEEEEKQRIADELVNAELFDSLVGLGGGAAKTGGSPSSDRASPTLSTGSISSLRDSIAENASLVENVAATNILTKEEAIKQVLAAVDKKHAASLESSLAHPSLKLTGVRKGIESTYAETLMAQPRDANGLITLEHMQDAIEIGITNHVMDTINKAIVAKGGATKPKHHAALLSALKDPAADIENLDDAFIDSYMFVLQEEVASSRWPPGKPEIQSCIDKVHEAAFKKTGSVKRKGSVKGKAKGRGKKGSVKRKGKGKGTGKKSGKGKKATGDTDDGSDDGSVGPDSNNRDGAQGNRRQSFFGKLLGLGGAPSVPIPSLSVSNEGDDPRRRSSFFGRMLGGGSSPRPSIDTGEPRRRSSFFSRMLGGGDSPDGGAGLLEGEGRRKSSFWSRNRKSSAPALPMVNEPDVNALLEGGAGALAPPDNGTRRRGSFWNRKSTTPTLPTLPSAGAASANTDGRRRGSFFGWGKNKVDDASISLPRPKKKRWSLWGESEKDWELSTKDGATPRNSFKGNQQYNPSAMSAIAINGLADEIAEQLYADVIDGPVRMLVTKFVEDNLQEVYPSDRPERKTSGVPVYERSIASRGAKGMIYGKKRSKPRRYLPKLPKADGSVSPGLGTEIITPEKMPSDHWLGNLEEQMVPYFDLKHKPKTRNRYTTAFRKFAEVSDLLDYDGLKSALADVTRDRLLDVEMNYVLYLLEVMKHEDESRENVAIDFDHFLRIAALCEKVVLIEDVNAKHKITQIAEMTGDLKMLKTKIIWCRDQFFLMDSDSSGFITLDDLTIMMESGRVEEESREVLMKLLEYGSDDMHFQDFMMYVPFFCGAFLNRGKNSLPGSSRSSPNADALATSIFETDTDGVAGGVQIDLDEDGNLQKPKGPIDGSMTPETMRKEFKKRAGFSKDYSMENVRTMGRNATKTNVISPAVALLMLKKYDEEDRMAREKEEEGEAAARILGNAWKAKAHMQADAQQEDADDDYSAAHQTKSNDLHHHFFDSDA